MLYGDERLAKFLGDFGMRREIDSVVLKDPLVHEGLEQIVDVIAAEMRIAVGGENLKDVALPGGDQFQNGNVESAPAKVVDGDPAALFFMQTVGERCGGGLVDQAENFEARDFAGVLGGLALGVVEVRRHGDDSAVHSFAKVAFGPILQLAKNERRNLRRCENFVAKLDADDTLTGWIDAEREELKLALNVGGAAAHEAFDGIDGALGLGEQSAPRRLADDDAAVGIEADNGRAKRVAVRSRNTLRLTRLRIDVRDEAVGGAEVNADCASHDEPRGLKPVRYESSF